MGVAASANAVLAQDNALLRKFCGLQPVSDNDPFWNQLLSVNFKSPSNRSQQKEFEESLTDLGEALLHNTGTTGNFSAFVRVLLRRIGELKGSAQCDDKLFIWQTCNGLTILRYCCKFFTQRLTEVEVTHLFKSNVLHGDGQVVTVAKNEDTFDSLVEELLSGLAEIIVDVSLNDCSSFVHYEAVNCLIVLLSSQLFQPQPMSESLFMHYLLGGKCVIHACLLSKTLLSNYFHRLEAQDYAGGGSIVLGLAASFWSALQIKASTGPSADEIFVSRQCLLLLLVLACQSSSPHVHNPYRQALFSFGNSQEKTSLISPTNAVATFTVDYARLYDCICQHANEDSSLLLLYLLLHQNQGFKNYILSRVNMELLVVPVLKALFSDSAAAGTYHLYLSLIIILILSEDDFFCKVIHETNVYNIDWYSDRNFTDMSLGGLIVLVLIKRIHVNIVKVRDRYMHTNCFAALSNMAPFFKNLPIYVSQKLVSLLEAMSKRHTRCVNHVRLSAEYDLSGGQEQQQLENMEDIAVLEEGIRMLLEVVNGCLQNNLRYNPHLVYTLLYKRELIDALNIHASFQDLIQNIDMVLEYFNTKINALDKSSSPSEVSDVIQRTALQWPTDRLKKFPALKFKYVEDPNTEEFFVPYVWTLVFLVSGLYWDSTKVKLFNAQTLLVSASNNTNN